MWLMRLGPGAAEPGAAGVLVHMVGGRNRFLRNNQAKLIRMLLACMMTLCHLS